MRRSNRSMGTTITETIAWFARTIRLPRISLFLALALGVASRGAFPKSNVSAVLPPCRVVQLAQLPMQEIRGQFVTTIGVNDQNLTLLIDTGAGGTILTPRAADRLGLPEDFSKSATISGFGSRSPSRHPRIARSIRFGPLEWHNQSIFTADFIHQQQQDDPASPVGVLGADLLSQFDVEFDFPKQTMTLYQPAACFVNGVPWTNAYERFRPMRTAQNAFVIPVSVNGQPLFGEIDTGAQTTSITRAAALSAGISEASIDREPPETATVANGADLVVRRHSFDSLKVGGVTMDHVPLYVDDTLFGVGDVLLGSDFLRDARVWVSYSTNQVFMQYTRGPVAAAIQKAVPQADTNSFAPVTPQVSPRSP
jgi:predicted aspartyl protease